MLEIDLDRLRCAAEAASEVALRPWNSGEAARDRIGCWSGAALALAVLLEHVEQHGSEAPPFVIAVGDAVRRGLPTAARATVAGRAALTGLFADGQVGGELGRRLASVADALVLRGRVRLPGAVLHLGAGGRFELLGLPELAGLGVGATGRLLAERFGPAAVLCVGPAGERGALYASLANGEDPPSFVGRGGLGATFGAFGIKALVVSAPAVPEAAAAGGLIAALTDSPRLVERSDGGTLELIHAFGARGDLRARNYTTPVPRRSSERLAAGAGEALSDRRGCRGCPTPCGWVFERSDGGRQGARFSAVYALGLNLGLEDFDATLSLLAACDRVGVDAKEAGAALAVLATARERGLTPGPELWGQPELLIELIEGLGSGAAASAPLARGSAALAAELGLPSEARVARGQAARPESNLAVVLGQCVSTRGPDPMRSFPFLVGDAGDRERLEELLAPLSLPEGAEDGQRPEGKGRLVWWHENFAAAVDMSGFCAFSAAALLVDGVLGLDELAEIVLPATARGSTAGGAGRDLLAAGASLVLLQRRLGELLGAPPDADRPAWAAERVDQPGMWDEYRLLRGLDPAGRVLPETLALLGTPELLEVGREAVEEVPVRWGRGVAIATRPQAPGRCSLHSFGALAVAMGGETRLLLLLPATLEEVLDQLVRRRPGAAPLLYRDGRPLAVVYRHGQRLGPADWIEDGDALDLVLTISGG